MSLVTGYTVDRKQWAVFSLSNHVIKLVEDTVTRQQQTIMGQGISIFEWRPCMLVNEEIGDNQEDEPNVQLKERHANNKKEIMDGGEDEHVVLSDEESENEDFNIDKHDNIPKISDNRGNSND